MDSKPAKIDASSWDGSLSRSEFYVAACAFAERWNKFNSALPQCSWVPSPRLPWLAASSQGEGYLSMDNIILPRIGQEDFHQRSDEEGKEELSCSDKDSFIDEAMLHSEHFSYARNRLTAMKDATMTSTLFTALLTEFQYYSSVHAAVVSSFPNQMYGMRHAMTIQSKIFKIRHLYFNPSDGQPLALDDIEKNIPGNSTKALMESKWTFITQEDHPYLNRPWYTLHPCGTRDWMKMLFMNEHSEAQDGVGIAKYLVSWFSVVGQVFGLKIPFEMLGNLG